VGFGNMINYQPEDEETNVAVIKRAFELGINFFDTAENYGAGKAEEALGRALKQLNIPREKIVVTTKIINRVDGTGSSRISIDRECYQQDLD
jgi:aryl-alcohol dehydrogenase-like predicted oxidoreductase